MHWLAIRAIVKASLPGHLMIFQTPRIASFLERHPELHARILSDVMALHMYVYEYDLATARQRLQGFMWGN